MVGYMKTQKICDYDIEQVRKRLSEILCVLIIKEKILKPCPAVITGSIVINYVKICGTHQRRSLFFQEV